MDNRIREWFGFAPPEDFALLWEFARLQNPEDPTHAFEIDDVTLVGPFDVLAGRFDKMKPRYDPCLHWRFFGDPPEFVTLLDGANDGLHWGYVVEEAGVEPVGLAGYYAYDDVNFFGTPTSLLGLVREGIVSRQDTHQRDASYFPEDAEEYLENAAECQQLLDAIDAFGVKHNIDLETETEIDLIDQCNDPVPLAFPAPENFFQLPELAEGWIQELMEQAFTETEARLCIGRFLWHWHHNGNKRIEDLAFSLLQDSYQKLGSSFHLHVLKQHKKHRHRASLDVFRK